MTAAEVDTTFKRYVWPLYYVATGFIQDAQKCEDVVAHAFVQLHDHATPLNGEEIYWFLHGVVQSGCQEYYMEVLKMAPPSLEQFRLRRLDAETLNILRHKIRSGKGS